MAGAGQPFYMPLTWPIGHVSSGIMRDPNEKVSSPTAAPDLDIVGQLTSCVAASRSFLMALGCIYLLFDGKDGENAYPAFGPAKTFEFGWVSHIFLRNMLAAWFICGSWDWFLYFSPLKEKLHKYKLNQRYPPWRQFKHDAFYTTTATWMGSILECGMCHLWATGVLSTGPELTSSPSVFIYNVLFAVTMTHWRIPHFWAIHRGMHPWFKKDDKRGLPDVGRFLYKHVHALHHKSYNPTAFSGTNMHPVESFMYFCAALIAVPFGTHPAVFLGCVVDCAVGAWLGHDGFQWPGSGDYFHQLHHAHFECNYGAMHIPIDKWLGTYADKPIPQPAKKAK